MWGLAFAAAHAQSMSLEVTGLEPGGTVRAGVYADEDGWLQEDAAVASCTAPVRDGRAACEVTLPRAGRYAVAFFHDRDDDGVFDKSVLGLPREGFGFSRDAATGLSGPRFSDAAVSVGAAVVKVIARVRYTLTGD